MKAFTFTFFGTTRRASDALGILGYGSRDLHAAGMEDRPTGNAGHLLVHFHDPVQLLLNGRLDWYPPESFILWSPDQVHLFGVKDREWDHSWFWGVGDSFAREVAAAGLPTNVIASLPEPAMTARYLQAIHDEVTRPGQPDPMIVQNLIRNWLREIRRALTEGARRIVPPGLLAARRHVEAHWDRPLMLEVLAGIAHLSVPHFCTEFRRHFGSPPIAYQIRLRMQRAAHLLRNRNLGVTQIAEQVGYRDLYHFSKLFKKHHGASPSAMRRALY